MPKYTLIDLEKWPRKEHYHYYTHELKVAISVTSNIRIGKLLDHCHEKGYKFYSAFIAIVTKTVNSIDNLKMFQTPEGELGVWEQVVPNYTLFHEDDKTFSDCWSPYREGFQNMYAQLTEDMETYKNVKGMKVKPHQPDNFFCVSCAPWVSFTGCSSNAINGNTVPFFPIITAGKYERRDGEVVMPVCLNAAHAVCDGYHIGMFFEALQKNLDNLDF